MALGARALHVLLTARAMQLQFHQTSVVGVRLDFHERGTHLKPKRQRGTTPIAPREGLVSKSINTKQRRRCWFVFVVCLFVGWLTSQQQASVSQGRICTDNFTCCHTEIEVADPTFYLTQSQYTDTGPTSPSADPITPGAWQGSHWSANFEVTGMTRPRKNSDASGIRTRDLPLSRRTP